MKKFFPYLVVVIVAISLVFLIVRNAGPTKQINERITLKQKDKIPYGTYVAKQLLSHLFPVASIFADDKSPGNWDSILGTSYNQAVILMAIDFEADKDELFNLLNFARNGNYVFIIARSFSSDARSFFQFTYDDHDKSDLFPLQKDSLTVTLNKPAYQSEQVFVYPGKKFSGNFLSLDTNRTRVLGKNGKRAPDFIEYKTGAGKIFIHTAPLAFSNYFILHKKNINYYQQALSVIPSQVEKILWNEYYLTRQDRNNDRQEPNMLRVLMRYPAFKWGLITGMLTLLILAVLGSRRRQRQIPIYKKPQNDSLVFVKTLGRLYHDRKDHHNLAKKMSNYFLEHVRSVYKLPTDVLNDQFVQTLQYKSGYSLVELQTIVSFINYLEQEVQVDESQLAGFHHDLEMFYQNT